ncbi:RTA1 like protein-domain-containing protein [Aspergillus affinis]|uniref:RTA1 like protein-domain-containing protein n=1 Tax=Aspergillus affinis TaxID=1070780 RepID=UPI0022FE262D|nr:RTA1 like protein-domain-containing protein [Aspergillus affinis]KAI9045307.1 RTA1 like protein-domain-containing protein [Aspergillus affinis]
MSNVDSTWTYYHYDPSLPAALIFTVLFGMSSLVHTFQMLRAGIMVTGANGMSVGEDVVTAGLFIQIAFFGLFIATATMFLWRMQRNRSAARLTMPGLPWRKHLLVLYAASLLIMTRSVFRVAEYIQGNDGYLLRHEVFLYVFDALLMFVQTALLFLSHPSELLSAGKVAILPDGRSNNVRLRPVTV